MRLLGVLLFAAFFCGATLAVRPQCTTAVLQYTFYTLPNAEKMHEYAGHSMSSYGQFDSCNMLSNAHMCYISANYVNTTFPAFFGVCAPIECNAADLGDPTDMSVKEQLAVGFKEMEPFLNTRTASAYCDDANHDTLFSDPAATAVLSAFFIMLFFVVAGTMYDELEQTEWYYTFKCANCRKCKNWMNCCTASSLSSGLVADVDVNSCPDAAVTAPNHGGMAEPLLASVDADSAPLSFSERPDRAPMPLPVQTGSSIQGELVGASDAKADHASLPLRARRGGDATHPLDGAVVPKARDKQQPSLVLRLARCFSLGRNVPKLMKPLPRDPNSCDTSILNGIRVISMTWVILGHTIDFTHYVASNDDYMFSSVVSRWTFEIILEAMFSVDTFFWLSGVLAAHLTLQELRKRGKVNWFLFYLHRYLRLTPIYFFWLAMWWKVSPYSGDGPMWFYWRQNSEKHPIGFSLMCDKYWWTNILYFNNFWPDSFGGQCMDWTWYLANDMQLYVILPVFILLYHKRPMFGWIGIVLCGIGCWVGCVWLAADKGFIVALIPSHDENKDKFSELYQRPYGRFHVYFMGVACAFLWDSVRHMKIDRIRRYFSIVVRWTMYALAGGLMIACVFWPYDVNKSKESAYNWNKTTNVFFECFSRFFWALALSLMFCPMFLGYGGYLRRFLSHDFWVPLARLTFQAYLIHPIWIDCTTYSRAQQWTYNDLDVVFLYVTNCVAAYMIAFVGWVVLEKPVMNLESMLLPSRSSPAKPTQTLKAPKPDS